MFWVGTKDWRGAARGMKAIVDKVNVICGKDQRKQERNKRMGQVDRPRWLLSAGRT